VTDCIRGCVQARQHIEACEDQDACKGCEPREADYGLLCYGCHVRLLDWLKNAPWQHYLLGYAAEPNLSQALNDAIRATIFGAPSPLNVAAASAMTDLTDILSGWVEMLADQFALSGPVSVSTQSQRENPQGPQLNPRWSFYAGESVWCDPPPLFEIRAACTWLSAQIERLESHPAIGDLWGELGEVMSQAHALAPWREEAARLKGIACPECHAYTLARFGGDEHVTCTRCNVHLPPKRYAIWIRELIDRRGQPARLAAIRQALAGSPVPHAILTIEDAANLLEISPFTVKSWVERGQLRPVRPGAKPLLFRERDVLECHRARMTKALHARLDTLWAEILADLAQSA